MKGGGCALLMEQGTGKTLTSIAVAGRAFLNGLIKRVLVVAPASVVPVWPSEFEVHADFPHDVRALEGSTAKRAAQLEAWGTDPHKLQVAVINYEGTWRLLDELLAWCPDMIISDEVQRVKSPSARQSKAVYKIAQICKYRMGLTGTPVTQGPLDIWGEYRAIDPSIFGGSFWAFKARYAICGGFNGKQVVGYRNLPELIEKAHRIAFRVTKAEALDLPEFTDQTLYCELESSAMSLYQAMKQESVVELESGAVITATNVLSRLLRLSQLTGGFLGDEHVSKAKIKLLEETLIDFLNAGKKVVIGARFIPEIRAILHMLEHDEVGFAYITGAVKMADRGEEVKRFQTDPDCKVFVAQEATAGLGITLTAADTEILYSYDYSYAYYEQFRARIHRISQKNACTYIHLVARGTVDEKIRQVLMKKKDVADMIVDNWREFF